MVLSGTLREFILADVLQLLTQQKVTGTLILTNGRSEGNIIFKDGLVVGAVRDQESLAIKLFHYLTTIQQQPKNRVRELFSLYEGKIAELTAELEKRGILTHQELASYAQSVTEDITCSLFLWTTGTYRFASRRTVDALIPVGIAIPIENIVMEAMRRIDEWHRMRVAITEDIIFVHTGKSFEGPAGLFSPLDSPEPYIFQRINGTSPVKSFLTDSFLTDYKIYETIYNLIQSEVIRPLSEQLTKSIQAAIQRNEQDIRSASVMPPLFSLLISIGIILLIILAAWLYRGVIFSKLTIDTTLQKNEVKLQQAELHQNDAVRHYRAEQGGPPPSSIDSLRDFSSLSSDDRKILSIQQDFSTNKRVPYKDDEE